MTKRALEPADFPFFDYQSYSFSLGLETAAGVWLSGHTASRYATVHGAMKVAGEDIVAQARVAYDKIVTISRPIQRQRVLSVRRCCAQRC